MRWGGNKENSIFVSWMSFGPLGSTLVGGLGLRTGSVDFWVHHCMMVFGTIDRGHIVLGMGAQRKEAKDRLQGTQH
jgi:hypothetical protein